MKHPEITATHLHATETANQTLKKVSEVPAAYATTKKKKKQTRHLGLLLIVWQTAVLILDFR